MQFARSLRQHLPKTWQSWLIWLFVVILVVNFLSYLMIVALKKDVPDAPPVLQEYAETDLRLGDRVDKIETIDPSRIINTTTEENLYKIVYSSSKNDNLQLIIWHNGKIITEIQYPVLIEEKAKISEISLPVSPFIELWHQDRINELLRVYQEDGFAVSYHQETGTAYDLYQFFPENTSTFLSHHPEYASQKPEPHEEINFTKEMFKSEPNEGVSP